MRCILPLIVATVLFACSADGGGGNSGNTITLHSDPAYDGYVTWIVGPPTIYAGSFSGASVSIGDDASDNVTRLFVSFDLSGLPVGAQIDTATLRMHQNGTSSASLNSYPESGGLGWILVDNYAYTLSTSWADLFNRACDTGTDIGIGPIATSFTPNSWHELDVTNSALFEQSSYHNGRLQFLLYHHYESNHDGIVDTDGWDMGEDAANRPELVIKLK